MKNKDAMLWLCHVKGMWYEKMGRLLDYFGEASYIFDATERDLAESGCLKAEDIAEIMKSRKEYNKESANTMLRERQIVFLTEEDELYPKRLKRFEERPRVLFARGRLSVLENLEEPSVAVIGARVCSNYGIYTAEKFARELALHGVTIVSGMARGIDSAAHRGALKGDGRTVAVLGCGVDVCYPPENRQLYDEILAKGLFLSEYIPETAPLGWQFPKRNRIISGLSDSVIITEAKEKSGSLITARWALDMGIDVCAVPGRINDPLSKGCNELIRDGAVPAIDVSDIVLNLGINYKILKKEKKFLEKENEVVYSVLGLHPQSMDEILQKTDMKAEQLYQILLELQLAGLVEEPAKNYYVRKK